MTELWDAAWKVFNHPLAPFRCLQQRAFGECLRRMRFARDKMQHSLACSALQHESSRMGYDKRRSLWGGFCIRGRQQCIWFAGDTGYCPVFKEIGDRLGPIDLALVPIGNYRPAWVMRPVHCSPAEAVQIYQVLSNTFPFSCSLQWKDAWSTHVLASGEGREVG